MITSVNYNNGKSTWKYTLVNEDYRVSSLTVDQLNALVACRYLNNEHQSLSNNRKYHNSRSTIETMVSIALNQNMVLVQLLNLMLNSNGRTPQGNNWRMIEGNTGSGKIDRCSRVVLRFLTELHRIDPKLVNITITR
jgi:hypothetical protein